MTRTARKFMLACVLACAQFGVTTPATADEITLQPLTICDRHDPGHCYGPAFLMFDYSDSLGLIIDPRYVNNIGPWDALSLECAFGAKEFRGALTWGHIITPEHFVKVTLEYFAQEPDFRFFTENDSEWVGQKGVGISYSYRPSDLRGFVDAHVCLESNHAENETLKPIVFNNQTNFRRIEGGTNYALTMGITINPWPSAEVVLEAHHDSVKFEAKNTLLPTLVGVGGTVKISQNVSDNFNITVKGSVRQAYYNYQAKLNTLVNTAPGSRMEVFCRYSLSGGQGVALQENRYALGIAYSWGGNQYGAPASFHERVRPSITQELVNWTFLPVVRTPQVIAKSDEKVV